jgi:hypothetical protein
MSAEFSSGPPKRELKSSKGTSASRPGDIISYYDIIGRPEFLIAEISRGFDSRDLLSVASVSTARYFCADLCDIRGGAAIEPSFRCAPKNRHTTLDIFVLQPDCNCLNA